MEENGFFLFMSRIGDIVFLNLCFLLTCIPVVTAGTALISLYTVTLKMAENQEGYVVKSYFKAFKDNLKQGLITGIILELILAVLGYDAWVLLSSKESYAAAGFFITAAALLIVFAVMQYFFPLMARYDNSIKMSLRNAGLLAISRLPYTLVLIVVAAVPAVCVLLTPYAYIYVIFAGGALGALLQSKLLVNIFSKIENGGK